MLAGERIAMGLAATLLVPALLSLAAGAVQTNSARAQSSAESDTVPARIDSQQRMSVAVRIGDAGPFRFLIDTGAQNTVVSDSLADQLKLTEAGSAVVTGIAGSLPVRTVTIDELALGKRSYYGLLAPVLEEKNIGADGIVGVDGLQGQRVLIDFRKNLMTIEERRGAAADNDYDIVVTARRKSGQLIMTDARIDGVATNVVIDSGAEGTIGNLALQQALGKKGAALIPILLTSVTGQTATANIAVSRSLKIQGMEITNVAIAFIDAPPFRVLGLEKKPAILLGMRELRVFPRIAIDFPTRRVLFQLPQDNWSNGFASIP
ncbi:aspartyl protease family protein [Novosphingobium flavum]|uniref:Aspartyl protease family protein n=1 Tax=Novosphingobium flavum TaxID=1778672 RepID=A0A7X1KLX8_9SPHN|nr:retroviral-like aspartic protease family protein [Novosphingobium flavum]MBC2666042.1 aspartyl protease family protein [Novosphingobium flavum]